MKIPFAHQRNNYYCGPATLQMVLGAFGVYKTQGALAKIAKTNPKVGTSTTGMLFTLKKSGLKVQAGNRRTLADITTALTRGAVVIVSYTEQHWNWGHYAVVIGVDKNIRLQDPAEPLGTVCVISKKEFEKRWKDPMFAKTDHWAAFIKN